MRLPVWLLFPALAWAEPPMTARFDNEDILKGTLVSSNKQDGVLWDSSIFPEPQALSFEKLRQITIPSADEMNLPPGFNVSRILVSPAGRSGRRCRMLIASTASY